MAQWCEWSCTDVFQNLNNCWEVKRVRLYNFLCIFSNVIFFLLDLFLFTVNIPSRFLTYFLYFWECKVEIPTSSCIILYCSIKFEKKKISAFPLLLCGLRRFDASTVCYCPLLIVIHIFISFLHFFLLYCPVLNRKSSCFFVFLQSCSDLTTDLVKFPDWRRFLRHGALFQLTVIEFPL